MMPETRPITREVTIREYGLLYRGGEVDSIDEFSIPERDWDWLLSECLKIEEGPEFFRPFHRQGRQCLQAQNYVGSVETPSGIRIEILPKTTSDDTDLIASRKILFKMLRRVLKLKTSSWHSGQIEIFDQPLHEILIELFLGEVERLAKKGLRRQYVQQSDEQPFLRGRLRIEKQLHRRPGSKPEFAIEYHEFLLDRPENRLIHSAVETVSLWARSGGNQRRSRALRFLLADLQTSADYNRDFQQWSNDRGLADYRALRPWCELILNRQTPHTLAGPFFGMSFLFPMERLFEKYVEVILRTQMAAGSLLASQPMRHSLVTHREKKWLWLKPDLMVEQKGECRVVLDTKWKRINESLDDTRSKYGLKESDFYQMAAYGQTYLGGEGDLFLIYPRSDWFQAPLEPFELSETLRLWVVPFDLEVDQLGLPAIPSIAEWLEPWD